MADKVIGNVDIRPPVIQFHPALAHLNAISQLQQRSNIFSRMMMSGVMQGIHGLPQSDGNAEKECAVDLTSNSSISAQQSKTSSQEKRPPGQPQTRKRRRGVIEKRRRDRINSSLSELRRLVPAAFEKQGSQKLEKAEILHLAVQHLHHLASKGPDPSWLMNPDQNAAEFHSMGFRFCASEVDEFMSNEGIELHNPLRMRLSNHLQCFGAQRQSSFTAAQIIHMPNQDLHLGALSMGSGLTFANVQCR